jgi:hypothetical protein
VPLLVMECAHGCAIYTSLKLKVVCSSLLWIYESKRVIFRLPEKI